MKKWGCVLKVLLYQTHFHHLTSGAVHFRRITWLLFTQVSPPLSPEVLHYTCAYARDPTLCLVRSLALTGDRTCLAGWRKGHWILHNPCTIFWTSKYIICRGVRQGLNVTLLWLNSLRSDSRTCVLMRISGIPRVCVQATVADLLQFPERSEMGSDATTRSCVLYTSSFTSVPLVLPGWKDDVYPVFYVESVCSSSCITSFIRCTIR